jgi:hydrogenase maturation protein HypF
LNTPRKVKVHISGVVQGVGFRPFVYRTAKRCDIHGTVFNTADGVEVEAAGSENAVELFLTEIREKPPTPSMITSFRVEEVPFSLPPAFSILESKSAEAAAVLVTPDLCTCRDCLNELEDPGDGRYGYPFINCTNCGPRFTILRDIPYDRPNTTMASFRMCPDCLREYSDPADRRFHAQPNACPVCGPQVTLHDSHGLAVDSVEPIREGAALLRQGLILAVKGLGGFHLAVDASDNAAVERLRVRKHRYEKPLAIMVENLQSASLSADLSPEEQVLLESPARPIVLARKRPENPLSYEIAPRNSRIGLLLPYTPLHHLLLKAFGGPLVMTSGNLSEEPIVTNNREAFSKLGSIADAFLIHDRDIHTACDDSVLQVMGGAPRFIRRSRGYVPLPIRTAWDSGDVLALGADLKNTVCITRGREAFMSGHIGDAGNVETLEFLEATVENLCRTLDLRPVILAHDLHPGYQTTGLAEQMEPRYRQRVAVQHHHAHIVSCMAEHGVSGPVIGLAMDGTGYGEDGCVWGGEILVVEPASYVRKGHFAYVPLPGGEAAIREPWRMAVSLLHRTFGADMWNLKVDALLRPGEERTRVLVEMMEKGVNSPLTSSCGRLFDAAAALLGLRDIVSYEGQAAVELEHHAVFPVKGRYPVTLEHHGEAFLIRPEPWFEGMVRDLVSGEDTHVISGRFQEAVLSAWIEACRRVRERTGLGQVVLSGGVFQNRILLEGTLSRLKDEGFQVFAHERVPTNDACIALGQAVAAHARMVREGAPGGGGRVP